MSLREIIIFFNPVDPVNPVQIRRILLTTEDSKSTKKEDLFSNLRVLRALCGKDSSSNLLPHDSTQGIIVRAADLSEPNGRKLIMTRMINIARKARYKPFGPHTFCWRKTTDFPHPVCCRSEAEEYVPGAAGEGRKPVRAMLVFPFRGFCVLYPSSLHLRALRALCGENSPSPTRNIRKTERSRVPLREELRVAKGSTIGRFDFRKKFDQVHGSHISGERKGFAPRHEISAPFRTQGHHALPECGGQLGR